jgi:hypothetical protein
MKSSAESLRAFMPIIYDQNDEGCEFALLIRKYTELLETVQSLHDAQQKLTVKVQTDIDLSTCELRADLHYSYAHLEEKTAEIHVLSSRLAETIQVYNQEIDEITKRRIEKETDTVKRTLTNMVRPLAKEIFSKYVRGDIVSELYSIANKSSQFTSWMLAAIGIFSLANLILLMLIVFRVI